MKCKSDWEIKGVVGGLIDDDELVLLQREVFQIDLVLGSCNEVKLLSKLSLESDLDYTVSI